MDGAETEDIDAQIAKLQELKRQKLEKAQRAEEQRRKEAEKILVVTTPTKKRPRIDTESQPVQLPSRPAQPKFTTAPKPAAQTLPSIPAQPGKSSLSSSLAALRRSNTPSSSQVKVEPTRSATFKSRPQNAQASTSSQAAKPAERPAYEDELEVDEPGPQRDGDDLTILENLEIGPKSFGHDPEGGDEWLHLEPNSKVRLLKRTLPHAELQDHLAGRYYLPPSLLYSVIRLSRDGATYDVPVSGDWVTIAVVAERNQVKISGAKEAFSDDDGDDDDDNANANDTKGTKATEGKVKQGDKSQTKEAKARAKWIKRRGPRKYINLKLCALPPRNRSMGREAVAGDAMLQLLLFESDARIHQDGKGLEEGEKVTRYKGGSGGAYEKWCNLTVGSVIAILNPKVLRPLKSGEGAPHPLTLPLALNPTSADAITLIGQSQDLGRCTATQKDGNRCPTWVDTRVSQVCEYHVHAAIQRGRSGRAEFASATSSFALSTRGGSSGRGGKYDPKTKTGLLPRAGPQSAPRGLDNGGGGATYVVGGKTVNTHREGLRGLGDEHLSEKLGRGRADKKKRLREAAETEKALNALLDKETGGSSTGGKYLAVIRKAHGELGPGMKGAKAGKAGDNAERPGGSGDASTQGKGKGRDAGDEVDDGVMRKRPFNAGAIKRIGYDPTARRGERNEEETAKRLRAIASLRDGNDKPLKLVRPKGLTRSTVRAPPELDNSPSAGISSQLEERNEGNERNERDEHNDRDGDMNEGGDERMIDLD